MPTEIVIDMEGKEGMESKVISSLQLEEISKDTVTFENDEGVLVQRVVKSIRFYKFR